MSAEPEESQFSRHLRIVRITGQFLLKILKTSAPRVISCEGVPPDARLLRLGYDWERDMVLAVYEHPSFPLCSRGQIPEDLRPEYTEYHGDLAVAVLTKTVDNPEKLN